MVYELVGDYPAPSFFAVDSTSGEVVTTADLRTDNLDLTTYNVSLLVIWVSFYMVTWHSSVEYVVKLYLTVLNWQGFKFHEINQDLKHVK